jgi:ubiquinone/menaquinone biosynthesis C-methylase UbiE
MGTSSTKIVDPNLQSDDLIRSYYHWRADGYDKVTSYEAYHHHEAIHLADVQPDDHILEIACGTGRATIALTSLLGEMGKLDALDLSQSMLVHAQRKASENGLLDKVIFKIGSAQSLPYPDQAFDILYNAYMFDLIAVDQFLPILAEFKHVLKPGGRIVLVNMSKNTARKTLYERVYKIIRFFPCRPVLMESFVCEAGFSNVHRAYRVSYGRSVRLPFGTEIVTTHKPEQEITRALL